MARPRTPWLILVTVGGILLLRAHPACAHDKHLDVAASFREGFLHPITGVDHLMAMVAVGLISGVVGGRALATVPAVFVVCLVAGGVLGFYDLALVGVEWWILMSLLVLGVVLACDVTPRRVIMFPAVAAFGFAHGNAHGLELPMASSALGYAGGFALASAMCHASGILVAVAASRTPWGRTPTRLLGLATVGGAVYLTLSAWTS